MAKLDDKETAKAILLQGQSEDFWQLVIEALEVSRQVLITQQSGDNLKDLPAEQYKTENELLRAKIAYITQLMDYPNTIIQGLESPDNTEPNYDPYDKPKP